MRRCLDAKMLGREDACTRRCLDAEMRRCLDAKMIGREDAWMLRCVDV